MSLKQKWLFFSISGLLLVGAGLSVFGEALRLKLLPNASFSSWFWWGTLSLILLNSGLSFIGKAIICQIELRNSKKN